MTLKSIGRSSSVPVTDSQLEPATRRLMSVAFGLWQVAQISVLSVAAVAMERQLLVAIVALLMSTICDTALAWRR